MTIGLRCVKKIDPNQVFDGDVDVDDPNIQYWKEELKANLLRFLDIAEPDFMKQKADAVESLWTLMRGDWEYVGGNVTIQKFKSHCRQILKREQHKLHDHWVKKQNQGDTPGVSEVRDDLKSSTSNKKTSAPQALSFASAGHATPAGVGIGGSMNLRSKDPWQVSMENDMSEMKAMISLLVRAKGLDVSEALSQSPRVAAKEAPSQGAKGNPNSGSQKKVRNLDGVFSGSEGGVGVSHGKEIIHEPQTSVQKVDMQPKDKQSDKNEEIEFEKNVKMHQTKKTESQSKHSEGDTKKTESQSKQSEADTNEEDQTPRRTKAQIAKDKAAAKDSSNDVVASPIPRLKFAVGDKVKLKDVVEGTIVATGEVTGLWGECTLHNKDVLPPYIRVRVDEVICADFALMVPNPNGEQTKLWHVSGQNTVWNVKNLRKC